ncbi:guanylate kinase [Hyphomicrobium denitrificans ATCC 51888]|uniref:Guanylate kinase n=1 Tax=Hyphomicrobium denitrificans (strain ATCC 51888 / DSM 1869 / NCIMB 11706 / TK 0415) TaxID=582899 RepID=D8JYR1_HYPDA|nr:guanylate kinase [Hyphomicrobium denitrificans]ADJ23513.1 guanylate kinase [Hyphomicrobium denitrificans ATCC 51888]
MSVAATEPHIARRGLLFIISSPSGAGKTTLARRLLAADSGIEMSVSVTTRAPRPGEQDGVDYHFVDRDRFETMKSRGELLEWARVFDNYYGTPRQPVEAAIAAGKDVLFDIDWQGAQQLSEKLKGDVVLVFVLPPSGNVLEDRLKSRAQDTAEIVARRMAAASAEISHWAEYDYVIVNTEIEKSAAAVQSILVAERLKRDRLLGLSDFVRDMQAVL